MLTEDEAFVNDAKTFLTKREGYSEEDLADPEKIYDAYMEPTKKTFPNLLRGTNPTKS